MSKINLNRSQAKNRLADFEVTWTDSEGNVWDICLEWKIIESRSEISGLSITGHNHSRPLTSRILRQVPFGAIETQLRDSFSRSKSPNAKFFSGPTQSISRAELEKVAKLYHRAMAQGISAQVLIASTLNVSNPTASRRIRQAKDEGLILSPGLRER